MASHPLLTLSAVTRGSMVRVTRSDGEYRVTPKIAVLEHTHGYSRAEAMARAESLAAYCADAEEALATANQMQDVLRDWFNAGCDMEQPPFGKGF